MPAFDRKLFVSILCLMLAACSGTKSSGGSSGTTSNVVAAALINPKVGMNLSTLSYFTAEAPMLDRMKLGSAWGIRGVTVQSSWLDANGFPSAQAPDGTHWETDIPLDPATGTSYEQNYVVRWKGTGQVSTGIVNIVSTGDHTMTIQNVYGSALINIDASDPNDPIHDITVVRADQVADYDAGKIFNQTFLDRIIKPFASFRTMDWDLTNNSNETNWSDRQKPTDANWTRMPLELEVALANTAGVDLWKNIPAKASDDYVRQTLSYIKANLSPNLKLHLEYSNEVWNSGFTQNAWAAQQAATLWNTTSGFAAETYYGYRAAQVAAIGWSVFGTNSTQFKPVLGGWFYWTGSEYTDALTQGAAYANAGSISSLFREYAVAPYFGDMLGAGFGNEADRATVLQWANDTTGQGLTNAFQELEHGGLLQSNNFTLDDLKNNYGPHQQAVAKQYSLQLVAYEGGLSFYYFLADPSTKPTLQAFLARVIADPRMQGIYTRWLTDFAGYGGTLVENYNDVGALGEDGPWGSLETLYSDDTPRYTALKTVNALAL